VQIRERDEWIGWHPTRFLEHVRTSPSSKLARWLRAVVDNAIAELYIDDLVSDRIVSQKSLRSPDAEALKKLLKESVRQRTLHHRHAKLRDLKGARIPEKSTDGEADHWKARAKSHLFRSKRALALAELLEARAVMLRHFGKQPDKHQLVALLDDRDGPHIVKRILRKAKAERVGIAMADISVCGAVPPYNPILGGKLVSMLATSPEVVGAYRSRYAKSESEIASSMAAKPIIRVPHLVFLGTTSLYGSGSSQYNRIKIPCEVLGGRPGEAIEYVRLGMSESFGTSQFSDETIDDLVLLVEQLNDGQRVNHIFGEGVSPKMRKVREALELLGLPAETLLRHGRHRIVYGITLVRNTRDFLLGMASRPDFLIPPKAAAEASRRIAIWWTSRWLKPRVQSEDVLADVALHTLVHPITHGARVVRQPDAQTLLPFPEAI
jgi:hypothetical protein